MSETTLNAGLQTMPTPPTVGPPLWLLAEITYSCPLHCVFCYNPVDYTQSGFTLQPSSAQFVGGELRIEGGDVHLVERDARRLIQADEVSDRCKDPAW